MFSFIANFLHKAEIRESKDEILVGEIVRAMAKNGMPAIKFAATNDRQAMTFLAVGHPVLHAVYITLDRMTGGGAISSAILGSKASLTITAQVRNQISDPDDLVKMYKTDLANILKMPVFGGIKVNHQLNSVFARTTEFIEIDTYVLKGEEGSTKLQKKLDAVIGTLTEKISPYKRQRA